MRLSWIIPVAMALALSLPAASYAQNSQRQGFGGLTFGDVTNSSTFGGGIAVPLSDNLQIIGEAGRMSNVAPSLLYSVLEDFTPLDVGVSAWYGEGGVRVIGSSSRAIRPVRRSDRGFRAAEERLRGAGLGQPVRRRRARLLRQHRTAARCRRRCDRAGRSRVRGSRVSI